MPERIQVSSFVPRGELYRLDPSRVGLGIEDGIVWMVHPETYDRFLEAVGSERTVLQVFHLFHDKYHRERESTRGQA